MRKLLPLLACLMLVLTGWTSMAHAAEPIGCVETASADLATHGAGDTDEVPADDGKGYPHHHGTCHGHTITAPTAPAGALHAIDRRARLFVAANRPLSSSGADPALRPPQA